MGWSARLHDRIGSGEYQTRVTVGEFDQVGRCAVGTADLDDPAVLVVRADVVGMDVEPVADRCTHSSRLSVR
jgi:hypothetical protein